MYLRKIAKTAFVCILFTFIVFSLIEGLLRFTPMGYHHKLFIESRNNNGILVLNTAFANHFCHGKLSACAFTTQKKQATIRIFVLCSYINHEMPQNPNVDFTHILKGFLQHKYPEKEIEVIPLAFDTANLPLYNIISRQLRNYQPDAVLIYPESVKVASNRFFLNKINFSALGNLWTLQEISTALNSNKTDESDKCSLNTLDENFYKSLDHLVLTIKKNNIPVVLINTTANMLDFPPKKSRFSRPDSLFIKQYFEKGKIAFENQEYKTARFYLNKVYKKDKAHAHTCYYLGKLSLMEGDCEKAKYYLSCAADNDLSSQRNNTRLNQIIHKIAAIRNCPYVDLEKSFSNNSSDGIPGSNLFTGIHELNLTGSFIAASECFSILNRSGILPASKLTKKLSAVYHNFTPFDSLYEQYCYHKLHQKTDSNKIYLNNINESLESKLALLFSEKKTSWEESMKKLYDYYLNKKNYKRAFKIIENLALENPYNLEILNKASKTASMLGDSQTVIHYAKKAYNINPNIGLAQDLFIHYLKLDLPENALPYLNSVRNANKEKTYLKDFYNSTCEIIHLKEMLKENPSNKQVKYKIAKAYNTFGNYEVALLYR